MSAATASRTRFETPLLTATAAVAGGMLLTTLPLSSIFTDWNWLWVSILCVLPYLLVVGGFRYTGALHWWHSLLGLAGSTLMLFWVFVPHHLFLGVVPTATSLTDVGHLINQAQQVVQNQHTPVESNPGLRLLVAAALVVLLALTDVLGVLLRQPLLASAPLLEVLAVASATSSRAANPFWFAAAAIGFLLILLAGTRLQDVAWGPSVDGSAGRLGGGRRMAATGIVAALVIPLLLPAMPTNLLARATHHSTNGDGLGSGNGQLTLSSLASLQGQLTRPSPIDLFQVQVDPTDLPFYVRQLVDDRFTNSGWQPSGSSFGSPGKIPLSAGQFTSQPERDTSTSRYSEIQATFTILRLGGSTLPILANPAKLRVTGNPGNWNTATSTVTDVNLKRNLVYTEDVIQPEPTTAQLEAAPPWDSQGNRQQEARYLDLPTQPALVTQLVSRLTAGLSTPYDKARAISDYFTNGKNGFSYSLTAPAGDSQNQLVNFLEQKRGFCQQYAAAAAVLMRVAGLPSRVVIGYTHHAPGAGGVFVVSTADAHAWVEVFFPGLGWVPFDPTPLAGADLGRSVALPWAAHPGQQAQISDVPSTDANRPSSAGSNSAAESSAGASSTATGPAIPPLVWQLGLPGLGLLILLIAVVLGPRLLRRRQRRRRLAQARSSGNPEPLWLELAATANDRNALWPTHLTVGQVPDWLRRHGVDERGQAAVLAVAGVVERDRFSREPVRSIAPDAIRALDLTLTRWERRTDRRLRLRQRWLPRSLFSRPPRWRR